MDILNHEEKLRVTIHSDVHKISKEVAEQINMELDELSTSLIAELIWKKMKVISQDLEQFAKHAKRTTINAEDVKLLVRRNPSLKANISKMADEAVVKKKRQSKDKEAEEMAT
ncbi:hypothetical protein L9F63_000252 [Diploptera punctata]|uniref:Centromere protein S n=1 Tax=Diploptera punctata TaxID=6984 RepID=A0AAD8APT9_DIPPU|nr:hypothetical protein L9F63_000252 [Diploptera punctata]